MRNRETYIGNGTVSDLPSEFHPCSEHGLSDELQRQVKLQPITVTPVSHRVTYDCQLLTNT